jgi:hypothetical protein
MQAASRRFLDTSEHFCLELQKVTVLRNALRVSLGLSCRLILAHGGSCAEIKLRLALTANAHL